MIDPQKYIVFHREEWNKGFTDGGFAHAIEDAVVIRQQDIFAAPALYTYANSIRTVLEILSVHPRGEDVNKIQYLNELADYFIDMAAKAEASESKIPD